MKHTFFLFFVAFAFAAFSQNPAVPKRTCASAVPDEAWNTAFNKQVEAFKKTMSAQKNQNAHFVIPVVFHVIHGGEAVGNFPNISQAQIISQISILNSDFAGVGLNVTNFSSTSFDPTLIANCDVSFCLADKDPAGTPLAEKGIDRINYTAKSWTNPTTFTSSASFRNFIETTVKPNTIWDPRLYMNIWISDVNTNVGLLGYATFPPLSGLTGVTSGIGNLSTDGVWCWSRAIGDVGTLSPPFDKGRTLTHEAGHYLGLRHIWGDDDCATDYCNDTPTQKEANTGCPSYPTISCNNGPKGDMFMNFMDYSNDACLYMFTNDQRTRIQTAMSNSPLRDQLAASASSLCVAQPITCSYTVSNFSDTDTLFSYRRSTAGPGDAGCPQGNGMAGYILGTNCYGDKEKAEFIDGSKYSNVFNPLVSGVIVLFFQYGNSGTDGSGNSGIVLYSGTSASSAPGSVLGSVTENLSVIAASTNTNSVPYCGNPNLSFNVPLIMPYKFTFNPPVSVPVNGFYASVIVPNTPGDTVCVMDKNTGSTNTAWEKWSDNSWHDIKSAWGGGRNYNLAILPIIECGAVGVKEESLFSSRIAIFPNPSAGKFNILSTLPESQNLSIKVYNVLGQLVLEDAKRAVKDSFFEYDLKDASNGIYFVELSNGTERVVKRLILER